MEAKTTRSLIVAMLLTLVSTMVSAQQLAFPGAQGWGRFATGGRTGSVYHVTNLNDSGSGSLRDAVSQPNRIVVFDVAGVIRINSRIVFKSNITVAGQTAPGEGITVYGDGVSFSGATNVIVRYMRFRMGTVGTKDADCAGLSNGGNMIFDHCSFAWGQDENFSINWDNKGTAPHDVTLQNSIVGQGLMQHSAGGLIQADNITIYRVLLCDNKTRNFKVKGTHQYVNNIVYNWSAYAYEMGGESSGDSYANAESNLFINGKTTSGSAQGFSGGNSNFHFYGNDNWQDSNKNGVYDPSPFTGDGGGDRQSAPYDYPELEKWAGNTLVDNLLPDVGASLPYRDITDAYMVNEVLSFGKKGYLITSESDLPYGTPDTWTVFTGTKPADTDGDGMPDAWETANGTNPSSNDAMTIASNGYTNIENYINGISKSDRQYYLRAPMLLSLASSTTHSLTIEWADFSDNEEGFAIEVNGVEKARTAANVSSYTLTGLEPETQYDVRIRAFDGTNYSEYTSAVSMWTRPVEAGIVDVESFVPDYTWTGGTFDYSQASGNILLAPTSNATLSLSQIIKPATIVFNSDKDLTITGKVIQGTGSVNKAGSGKLTLDYTANYGNGYSGATVLHDGVLTFRSLANGGVVSAIGNSSSFAQNWVAAGGTYQYTGGNQATDRSMKLMRTTTFEIANNYTVTMNGAVEGSDATADFIIDGMGALTVNTTSFFQYPGATVLKGGTLKLNSKLISDAGIGSSSKLVLSGGRLTTVGKNEDNVTFNFPIEVAEGTTSTVYFDLWNTNKCSVSGMGTLQWQVTYIREYIEGNWDNFFGNLIIATGGNNGTNRQFAIRNNNGIKNATIYLKSGAAINGAKNSSTYYLGGLSGEAGSYLSGFNVKAAGNGTWVVGGANTDETFNGVIDDNDQARSHPGKTNIEKEGTGIWRLTGKNTYSGTTTVNGGTLIVDGIHTGTGAITVKSGTTLAGTGSLAGNVTLESGSTLQANSVLNNGKNLTFNGSLKFNSGVTLMLGDGGSLGTVYDGKVYQVFTGSASGSLPTIIPATPGDGQTWDTSQLLSSGILKVVGGEEDPALGNIIADIDFSNTAELDNGKYIIKGTKGQMTFTNFETGNSADNFNFTVGYGTNCPGILRVGNGSAIVDIPEEKQANETEKLEVKFDIWFGNLSGRNCFVELQNTKGERVAGFSLNAYNGSLAYNDFNDTLENGGTGMNILGNKKSLGSSTIYDAAICTDANKSSFTLIIDMRALTAQGTLVTESATTKGAAIPLRTDISDYKIAKIVVGSNYDYASGRRCWFDNLKVNKYESPLEDDKYALLSWGNMTANSYDNSSYNNMLVGNANDDAEGFSMVITGNLAKSYTTASSKLSVTYNGESIERTAIKLSNGAQNTIFMPAGARATKITLYSITGTNSSNRTSYWKEVAGKTYDTTTTTVLNLNATNNAPNKVEFELDDVTEKVTFTNTGEQQCVVVCLEYYIGERVTLDESATTAPTAASGVDVLVKRTINAGEWSTLVLPFGMPEAIVKETFGDDVQLADLTGYELEDNSISVNFQSVSKIEANHPYIIKTTKDITQFKVNSVTIAPATPTYSPTANASFTGTYVADTAIPDGSLFLSDNKFYYSVGLTRSSAFRGYFTFTDAATTADARLTFSIDGTTDLSSSLVTKGQQAADDRVYNLQGQRVSELGRGIYIIGGKKISKKILP